MRYFLKKKCNGLIWGKIVRKLIACFVSLTFPLEQHFSVSLVKQLRNLLLQITKVRIVSKRHSSHLWLYGWHQGYFHFHHGLSHVFLFTNKSDFSWELYSLQYLSLFDRLIRSAAIKSSPGRLWAQWRFGRLFIGALMVSCDWYFVILEKSRKSSRKVHLINIHKYEFIL